MNNVYTIVVLSIIFTISMLCEANFIDGLISSTCKLKNFSTNLEPIALDDIFNFLNSQEGTLKDLRDSISTVERTLEKSLLRASKSDKDRFLNITELIEKYAYTSKPEVHEVTTNDGYVLTMQRIPGNGPVVFLMHGLLGSADDYVTPGKNSLPFLLASEGYDVWLGNGRGSKHSRKHVSLSTDCEDFWDFSFDETGRYDLPSMIDYALDTSGKTNLTYVGFSQGTTNLLVLCSELPDYNEKISLVALLAPVCFMSDTKSPLIRTAALGTNYLMTIGKLLGLNEITQDYVLTGTFLKFVCGDNPASKLICGSILPLVSGFDTGLLDVERLPAIFAHLPGGCSLKQLAHYAQNILSGRFRKYNYEKSKNKEIYGSEEPPEYPLDQITTSVALFYGGNDLLTNASNVQQLQDNLPNVVYTKLMPKYGHVDLLWSKNSNKEVHMPLLKLIKENQG